MWKEIEVADQKKEKLFIHQRRFTLTVDICPTLTVTYLVACWCECSWAMMMLWWWCCCCLERVVVMPRNSKCERG